MTLIYRHFVATLGFLVFLFGVGAPVAHAFPVGSSGTPTQILYDVENGVTELDATVSYSSTLGPWIKELVINDESFGTGQGLPAGDSILLIEHITIDGALPWTDWHEQILTEFFTWGSVVVEVVDNGVVSPLDHTFALDGTNTQLDIFFDDLQNVGTELLITKQIILDTNAPFVEPFEGSILIAEFPTIDEPAAMMMFGFGLVALGLARRRWIHRTS